MSSDAPGLASQVVPSPRPVRPVTYRRAVKVGGIVGLVTGMVEVLLVGFAIVLDFGAAFGGHPYSWQAELANVGFAVALSLVACAGMLRGYVGVPIGWAKAAALSVPLCATTPLALAVGWEVAWFEPLAWAIVPTLVVWVAGLAGWALLARRILHTG